MHKSVSAVLAALMLATAATGVAREYKTGELIVVGAWTRATARGQSVAAGYLEVRNAGRELDRFIGATTPAAERVELHILVKEGEVMKMREVKGFDVPAGGKVELKPRGPHMMIIGIKRAFGKDERIPVTLKFERAGDVAIELVVEGIDAGTGHRH